MSIMIEEWSNKKKFKNLRKNLKEAIINIKDTKTLNDINKRKKFFNGN